MKKILLSVLVGCLSVSVTAGDKQHEGHEGLLVIKDAFIRALPPGQLNTAAFMTMTNPEAKAYTLKSLYSEAAEKVELHSHTMNDGIMQMRPIDNFSIKGNAAAVFAPGGNHVMFIGLKEPLKEGGTVLLNMCFDEFCQQIELPVVSVLNEKTGHQHHH